MDGSVTPYQYSCFGRFARYAHARSGSIMKVLGLATVTFIVLMSIKEIPTDAKCTIGYSFLSAAGVIGLIYIPYRRELHAQREHAHLLQAQECRASFQKAEAKRKQATEQMEAMEQVQPLLVLWHTLEPKPEKDPSNLEFRPEEVSHPLMRGTFKHPLLDIELPFYVIKYRDKNRPNREYVLTFSQRYISPNYGDNWEFFCLGGRSVIMNDKDGYIFTGEGKEDIHQVIRQLVEDKHPTCELIK